MSRLLACSLVLALMSCVAGPVLAIHPTGDEPPVLRSRQSGPWSAKETWDAGRVPKAGDQVVILEGHHVLYDVQSTDVIRLVQVAGTLEFARDRDTLLEVGLLTVSPNELPCEEGFDCQTGPMELAERSARPTLLVGRPNKPIPAEHSARIRLHYVEGMNKASCPAIVCCTGRMEFHGSPVERTWVKLERQADAGAGAVAVAESVQGWKKGDLIIVTSTRRRRNGRGDGKNFEENSQTEERRIRSVSTRPGFEGGYDIRLDKPLRFTHYADDHFQAEVGLLTRNVVVESAEPDGIRGHTMYHSDSMGSISYAEFRHLGKKNELGRYTLHFHLCGKTMRGSSVIGASIWDSHNRWLTIHGTDALVVRDCVGYKSVGHGFFLEDGTEVNNILDHNLAVFVLPGKAMEKQVVPFDPNRGAGFWWANCQNSFTRNVAVDCAEYGYRFDCKQTDDFNPILPIRQPDGTTKNQDIRTLPFVRFQDNEAHTMRFFCLNLRGMTRPGRGLNFYETNSTLAREAAEARPEPAQPFWIRDFKCWEANWATHLGTTGVFLDGLEAFRADVGIWRSIMDRSGFRRLNMKSMRVNDIHNPLSMAWEEDPETEGRRAFRGMSSFHDIMPPTTVITHTCRDGNLIKVRGVTSDSSDIDQVLVNGHPAYSTRGSFAEWEVTLEAPYDKPFEVTACAEDVHGHVETHPHLVVVECDKPIMNRIATKTAAQNSLEATQSSTTQIDR